MHKRTFLKSIAVSASALGLMALTVGSQTANAAEKKLTIALPGVPPIFGSVFTYVARDAGIYKKYEIGRAHV